jgi:hypothetical protein
MVSHSMLANAPFAHLHKALLGHGRLAAIDPWRELRALRPVVLGALGTVRPDGRRPDRRAHRGRDGGRSGNGELRWALR